MQELKSKRTHNSKTFLNENGSFNLQVHSGVIHYFDKLDSKRFREIDWKLQEGENGWFFNYNNFRPLIPFYSDDWAEFRDLYQDKDQTIKYKAIGKRVKGELVEKDEFNPNFDDNPENKGVLYKDVFGKGEDLMYYFTRSKMVKVAIINNPNAYKKDAVFEWEVEFPDKDIQRGYSKDKIKYQLDKTRDKEFDTDKKLLIGDDKKDDKEWFTYIEGFKAWDTGDEQGSKSIIVKAKLYHKGRKYILQKTIPLEFLQNAKGKVYTDTTTSYYAGAGNGWADTYTKTTWDLAHDATASPAGRAFTDTLLRSFSSHSSTDAWFIQRVFLPFDTSAIPDTDTVSAATLYLWTYDSATFKDNDDNDGDDFITVVQTSQASTASITEEDYDQCGAVHTPTEGTDARIDITGMTRNSAFSFVLNATGRGWINKTGWTKLGVREGHDIVDSAIVGTAPKYSGVYFYNVGQTGTDQDPYLEVTYSAAATETVTVSTLTLLGVG